MVLLKGKHVQKSLQSKHDSEIRSIKHLRVTFVNVKLTMSIANILLLVEHAPGKKVTNSKYFEN